MITYLIPLIRFSAELLTVLVMVQAVLSWVMSPYHPVRQTLDRLVAPLLAPIRRVLPPAMGTFDFSPIVFIIIVQVLTSILIRLLATLQ